MVKALVSDHLLCKTLTRDSSVTLKNTERAQGANVVSLENLHFDDYPKQAIELLHLSLSLDNFSQINKKNLPFFYGTE